MLKNSLVILLILFFNLSFAQSNSECGILKNCKLKYLDSDDKTSYIEIKYNYHIEYHRNVKYYIKSELNWINDCEYNMKMTEITLPDFPFKSGEIMNVKIIKIEGIIAYIISTVRGESFEGRFEIIEIL
jgi:hypothetical protein